MSGHKPVVIDRKNVDKMNFNLLIIKGKEDSVRKRKSLGICVHYSTEFCTKGKI